MNEVIFILRDRAIKQVSTEMNSAKESIRLAMFHISAYIFVKPLIDAHNRGIDDYERAADILNEGDTIQIDMEDFEIGEEVDGVIRWVPLLETKKAETPWLKLQPQEFQDLVKAVQKATASTWGEIGQKINAMKDQFTKTQKDVLFTEYRIKKHKIYQKVERKMKSDARSINSKIKAARSQKELASLGKFMYTVQKEGTKKISDIEWTILWNHFHRKKEKMA